MKNYCSLVVEAEMKSSISVDYRLLNRELNFVLSLELLSLNILYFLRNKLLLKVSLRILLLCIEV